jgi:hypothetical protein
MADRFTAIVARSLAIAITQYAHDCDPLPPGSAGLLVGLDSVFVVGKQGSVGRLAEVLLRMPVA